jgi:hypothetical protein
MSEPAAEAIFSQTIYASCPICHGARSTTFGPCTTCADPEPAKARRVLERLSVAQMAFLRAYRHTLAAQPLTKEEHDALCIEYFVEENDGEFDDELDIWLVPNTRIWFASGQCRFGPCGSAYFIRYNPLGLLLRECLMAGADALVRHEASKPPTANGGEKAELRAVAA